eukprot:TRINITY_DN36105_c0_g1_i2.p1 TRINITY_DN36105_c0_g1~~TRINITY_DN36105_c0_g1_i2.p1  ORF type:complete len:239 (-),score=43.22 TRINITY_DN36105_c0_g1_i2:87-803(-)
MCVHFSPCTGCGASPSRPGCDVCVCYNQTTPKACLSAVYASPSGDDTNPGSIALPVATIPTAAPRVRAARSAGELCPGPTTIWLRAGDYVNQQRSSAAGIVVDPISITPEDSGTPGSPTVLAAYRETASSSPELVRVLGALTVPASEFSVVPDPAALGIQTSHAVFQASLTGLGIEDYGTISSDSHVRQMEVFFAEHPGTQPAPMTLARYPNLNRSTGRWEFMMSGCLLYTSPSPRDS